MEKKRIFRSLEDEQLYNLIEGVSDYWHKEELPDHPLRLEFDRKLLVTGFNCPTNELYVVVVQTLTFKDSGELYETIPMPMWHVTSENRENIITADGSFMLADEYDLDPEGNIIEESKTEAEVKVNSAKYIRALTTYRWMYIPEVFSQFMVQYKEYFAKEIDDI